MTTRLAGGPLPRASRAGLACGLARESAEPAGRINRHGSTCTDVVISGPPGVGKTTVAWEVFSRAAERDEAPALADLDLLGAAWPAPVDDPFQHRLKARNLASVWSNFRETGSRCLIVAAVIETAAELDLLGSAVGAEAFLCRLTAPDDTLADRIRDRGRDFGDDLTKLVKRSAELSELLANHDVSDLVVDTEGQQVGDVAETLLAAWQR